MGELLADELTGRCLVGVSLVCLFFNKHMGPSVHVIR